MRGRGCGDDAPGCGGEWGRGDGTTLAGRLWAMATAGLGAVGSGSRGVGAARPVELAAGAAGLRLGTSAAMGLGGGRPWWADSSCWRLAVGYGDGGIGGGGLGWQRTGSSSVDLAALAAGLRLVTLPVAGLGGGGQGGRPWRRTPPADARWLLFFGSRLA